MVRSICKLPQMLSPVLPVARPKNMYWSVSSRSLKAALQAREAERLHSQPYDLVSFATWTGVLSFVAFVQPHVC